MTIIHVAVAVIKDEQDRLLITQRAKDIPHGGLWEFPGGKVEPKETPYEALIREISEEVGLKIEQAEFLGEIYHTYPEKSVCLHIFQVLQHQGEAQCCDGQLDLCWVEQQQLRNFRFPEANQHIIELLSLDTHQITYTRI